MLERRSGLGGWAEGAGEGMRRGGEGEGVGSKAAAAGEGEGEGVCSSSFSSCSFVLSGLPCSTGETFNNPDGKGNAASPNSRLIGLGTIGMGGISSCPGSSSWKCAILGLFSPRGEEDDASLVMLLAWLNRRVSLFPLRPEREAAEPFLRTTD